MHRLNYGINFRHNFFTRPNFEYQIGRNQFNDTEFRIEFGDKKFRSISWEFEIWIFYENFEIAWICVGVLLSLFWPPTQSPFKVCLFFSNVKILKILGFESVYTNLRDEYSD